MSRLVICLYFHWHPLFPNISVFSCCNLFALLLFLSVYLFSLRSVKQILFTHSLCIICLCHTLCSVILFVFFTLCVIIVITLGNIVLNHLFPWRLFFMIMGTFIWAKCLLANTMALNCLLPNCAFSHFNSMAIHHEFCVAYVSRVVVIYYLTRNYCADFAIWLKRKHPTVKLWKEKQRIPIFFPLLVCTI